MSHLTQVLMENSFSQHSEFWEGPSHSGADHSSEDSAGGRELFLGLTQGTVKHFGLAGLALFPSWTFLFLKGSSVPGPLKPPVFFLFLSFD